MALEQVAGCLCKGPIKMSTRHEETFQKFRPLRLGHISSSYLVPSGAGNGKVSFWHLGAHKIFRTVSDKMITQKIKMGTVSAEGSCVWVQLPWLNRHQGAAVDSEVESLNH